MLKGNYTDLVVCSPIIFRQLCMMKNINSIKHCQSSNVSEGLMNRLDENS